MARPIIVNIPHALGKEEARRRIAEGFDRLRQQITGSMAGFLTVEERWEGDRLYLAGGGLGQRITGRIDVLEDSVQIQVDLPDLLAGVADAIAQRLRTQGQKLLGRTESPVDR